QQPKGVVPAITPPRSARGAYIMPGRTNLGYRLTPRFARTRFLWSLGVILGLAVPAAAALPGDPGAVAKVVGKPASLVVQPALVTLSGPRAMQQLVITGKYDGGGVRDLTPFAEVTCANAGVARVEAGGFVLPGKNGATTLVVKAGGKTLTVKVT